MDENDFKTINCEIAYQIFMKTSFDTVEDEEAFYEFINQVHILKKKYTKPVAALLKKNVDG